MSSAKFLHFFFSHSNQNQRIWRMLCYCKITIYASLNKNLPTGLFCNVFWYNFTLVNVKISRFQLKLISWNFWKSTKSSRTLNKNASMNLIQTKSKGKYKRKSAHDFVYLSTVSHYNMDHKKKTRLFFAFFESLTNTI